MYLLDVNSNVENAIQSKKEAVQEVNAAVVVLVGWHHP